jgi:hypothetical protein
VRPTLRARIEAVGVGYIILPLHRQPFSAESLMTEWKQRLLDESRTKMPTYKGPDPPFPHISKNRFPLPGVITLDRLRPNAEPLDFLLAIMRDDTQPMWRRIEAAKAAAPYRHIRIDDPFFRTLSDAQSGPDQNGAGD